MKHDALSDIRAKLAVFPNGLDVEKVIDEALRTARLLRKPLYTSQELYDIAEALISKKGFVEMVGRTLKVRAILAGAQPR